MEGEFLQRQQPKKAAMSNAVIEILTEEPSMESFLREVLPQVLPADYQLDINCFIRPHEGKSSLQKSIPRKIKAFSNYGYQVKVLIIHDQDSNDCKILKNDLSKLCESTNIPVVIRIACRELENWYLGDMQAIEKVYPESKATSLPRKQNYRIQEKEFGLHELKKRKRNFLTRKAKYRNPDKVFGAHELKKMTSNFSKTRASREIPKHMIISSNNSPSFNHFLTGLTKLISL